MNTTAQTPKPKRGQSSRCSAFADLLPLLDSPGLDAEEDASVRAHLSFCAACQAKRAAYHQMTLAARRSLSPAAIARRHQTEELLASIMQEIPAAPEASISSLTRYPLKLQRSIRPRRFIADLVPLAAVLVIVLLTVSLFANQSRSPGGVASNPPPPSFQGTQLTDISMISPTEGWAAGYTGLCTPPTSKSAPDNITSCQPTGPILLHYLNGAWSAPLYPFKQTIYNQDLESISMDSATDGWASGAQGLLLHYDGHAWETASNPTHWTLNRIQMLSATNGWAIGGDANHGEAIAHYDGKSWTAQPLPASLGTNPNIIFFDLTMVSPTEGWVLGTLYPETEVAGQTSVILHFINGQWTVQMQSDKTALESISMSSATDGWAVGGIGDALAGEIVNGDPLTGVSIHPILFHYTQGKWTQVTLPGNNTSGIAWQVAMVSTSNGWGIGPKNSSLFHLIDRQWLPVATPTIKNSELQIMRLQMLSATEGWAVGTLQTTSGHPNRYGAPDVVSLATLILHYHNGTWSIFPTL